MLTGREGIDDDDLWSGPAAPSVLKAVVVPISADVSLAAAADADVVGRSVVELFQPPWLNQRRRVVAVFLEEIDAAILAVSASTVDASPAPPP